MKRFSRKKSLKVVKEKLAVTVLAGLVLTAMGAYGLTVLSEVERLDKKEE